MTGPPASEATRATGQPRPLVRKTWVYRLIMFLARPLYAMVYRARIVGHEHVPRTGPVLLASNHASFLDIPLVAMAVGRRHVGFIARDSLARSRVLGFIMRHCGVVLIRRDTSDRAALRLAAEHMRLGDVVAIFPEGTRSADGGLAVFKRGALLAARMAKAPILPCGIRGSFGAWPRTARWPGRGRLELHFGPLIDSSLPDAFDRLRASILALTGQEDHTVGPDSVTEAHAADPNARHRPRRDGSKPDPTTPG
ncbi:MAG: 1-acyl-sn-glycerol-3-phosphate acyltransferase [Planctomycetota bacterium]|nr:MAG: 1-acyl-sn-glycerol-3-phosphate acyltransferase [Planctomycetota bacterium]